MDCCYKESDLIILSSCPQSPHSWEYLTFVPPKAGGPEFNQDNICCKLRTASQRAPPENSEAKQMLSVLRPPALLRSLGAWEASRLWSVGMRRGGRGGTGERACWALWCCRGSQSPGNLNRYSRTTGGYGQAIVACPLHCPILHLLVSVFELLSGLELFSQVWWLQS